MGKNAAQGIAEALKEFAAIKADREKIKGDILANRIKEQNSWFYKMKEMKTKNDMDWQNRQRELEAIKNMFGGQEQPAQPSGSYFGAGVNPSGGGVATAPAQKRMTTQGVGGNAALENLKKRLEARAMGVSVGSTRQPAVRQPTFKENFNDALSKAASGEIGFEDVQKQFPVEVDKIRKIQRQLTMAKTNPNFKAGTGGMISRLKSYFDSNQAELTPPTRKVIENINTEDDIKEFISNIDKYSAAGVDTKAILEYFGEVQ